MPKSRVALIAAVVIALMCVPFFFLGRSSSTGITLHYAGSEGPPGEVVPSIAITNHTGSMCQLRGSRLDTWDGNTWNQYYNGISWASVHDIQPHSGVKLRCYIKPLPPSGTHVRLEMVTVRAEGGLPSFIWRVKQWRSGHARFSSLFDTKPIFFRDRVISLEFTVP
jgi:hypothetical protein